MGTFRVSVFLAAIALATAGCGGAEPPAPPPAPAQPAKAPPAKPAPPATPDVPKLNKAQLEKTANRVALVPSPVETQRALASSGIETKLAELIPEHSFDLDNADTDHAALRSGVFLADALLTVKTAKTPDLNKRLAAIKKGLNQLGGGDDIVGVLDEMQTKLKAGAITRDELLRDFDELSGAVIPELEFNGQERVVPLIQAGSWLEGANLVAKAVKASGNASAADSLLKQPAVVDYFIGFVKSEKDRAPEAVTSKLQESLSTLKALANKTEALEGGDIDTVIQVTDDVLALL
jgi:hypothetical protein